MRRRLTAALAGTIFLLGIWTTDPTVLDAHTYGPWCPKISPHAPAGWTINPDHLHPDCR